MRNVGASLLRVRMGRRVSDPWPWEQWGLSELWYAAQPVARVAGCILEFAAPPDTAKVAAALTALRERHSDALGVTLARTSAGRRHFARCTSQPSHFADEAIADPWSLAERELVTSFPDGGPLWRVRMTSTRRALVAVLCMAALVAVAASHEGFPLRAQLLSPVSLRAQASPVPAGFGAFICAHETLHHLLASDSFWRAAEAYGLELRGVLPAAHERVGLLRFAGDLAARAAKMTNVPNARTGTLEVSNLGRLDGLDGTPVWFIQGNHYHGPLFNLTVGTCALTGVLRATLSVAEPVVAAATASAFVQDTARALEHVARGSHTLGEVLAALQRARSLSSTR
jgi:hypothetical protein